MRRATFVVYLALAGVAAIAAAAGSHPDSSRSPIRTEVGGAFSFASSREGLPVFTASGIAPGDSTSGTVEVANEGSEPLALTLSQRDLVDVPGSGGGVLSQRLQLKVEETGSSRPTYEGPIATMQPRPLGLLAPGAERTYEFTATLPDGGAATAAAENAVQGASTSVTYSWTAGAAPASAPPSPAPARPDAGGSPSAAAPSRIGVRLIDYRDTLRNGRIVAWVRCSQPCRVRSYARFLAPRLPDDLPATAHHAQRRRFGARTRRLAVRVPARQRRLLLNASKPKVLLVVTAHAKNGGRARRTGMLRLLHGR